MPVAAEAEDRRWVAELLREVRERRDADAAADEERLLDVEPVAVAERAEDVELVARLDRGQRARSGPIASSRKLSSPGGAWQRLIGRGRSRPGASSMKNCPGTARLEPASLDADQRVGADRLVGDDSKPLSSAH